MISLEEAVALLNKWKATLAQVAVLGEDLRWKLHIRGQVSQILFSLAERTCDVSIENNSGGSLRLTLTDIVFEYQEPHGASPLLREGSFNVKCFLRIGLPEGESFTLYELSLNGSEQEFVGTQQMSGFLSWCRFG
ncbi:MAG: hypothetical protein WCA91_11520 [Candidatus Acidiferrales bacterium]